MTAPDKPEALRIADVLDKSVLQVCADAAAELRRLHDENERLRVCFDEWIAKTEWVQETVQPKELGMHRADIMTQRIRALSAALKEQGNG